MKPLFEFVRLCVLILLSVFMLQACRTGTGIFGKKSPHEQYGEKLTGAGLRETALGRAWFDAANRSLSSPLAIAIPYKETGYFAADQPNAAGLRFQARQGEKLNILLDKRPADGFTVYLELWKVPGSTDQKPKLVAAADTLKHVIEHEVDEQTTFIIRVQPELLKGGEYTLSISAGPSLAYPIRAPGKNHTQSFWGDPRDGGGRKHEGIDMFAPKLTPVVAAADGRVTRVNENNLGGKVVWMRPEKKDYVLYYAHLDQQLVTDGQIVKAGDTLGLMGNTGNAQYTSPHLHFGIYTSGGPVDPFPFVNPEVRTPNGISAPLNKIGTFVRAGGRQTKLYASLDSPVTTLLPQHTLLKVQAATADWYKVHLPDGTKGLVRSNEAANATEIRKQVIKSEQPVFDAPDSLAPRKKMIKAGEAVSILAAFNDYYFVRTEPDITGWIRK
ncbi:MAG TPA: M23 family metallopeptidase [Chitinophagaceae bacterium]